MSNWARVVLTWSSSEDSDQIVERMSAQLGSEPDAVVWPCFDEKGRGVSPCCEGVAVWSINHLDLDSLDLVSAVEGLDSREVEFWWKTEEDIMFRNVVLLLDGECPLALGYKGQDVIARRMPQPHSNQRSDTI